MRVRMVDGKQRELVLAAKGEMTWRELSGLVGVPFSYLSGDIRLEKVLLSKNIFDKLCRICRDDYEKYVLELLDDSWGRSKGGINSEGSTLGIKIPGHSAQLAEFVGAVLGDGHVHLSRGEKNRRKIGVYQIRITGDLRFEKEYHEYLGELARGLFGLVPRYGFGRNKNERYLFLSGKRLLEFFSEMGILPGNKIVNESTIPEWVFESDYFLRACLRGLIDTDGSLHRMSRRDSNLLRINFKNHNWCLLRDVRQGFIRLGFNPSKIINRNIFYLSRQEEVRKYLKEIGFSNKKHLDRLKCFRAL